MQIENSNIFTTEELEILNKTKKIRMDIITSMTKDHVPDKVGEIRVLNEIMTGLDKSISDAATIRQKTQESQNIGKIHDTVAAILTKVSLAKSVDNSKTRTIIIADEYEPKDVVDGELEINPGQLDIESFIGREE